MGVKVGEGSMMLAFVFCMFMITVFKALLSNRRGVKDRQDEAGKLADSYPRSPAALQEPECTITHVDGRETEWSPKTERLHLKISPFLISNCKLYKF